MRGKIRELRIVFGSTHDRLLYFFAGQPRVVPHGVVQKTAQVPIQELERAERLMQEWLSRAEGRMS